VLLWRLTRAPYADLGGQGAQLYGGRWNSPGAPVVYGAAEPSTSVLEVRVHLDVPLHLLPDDYVLVCVSLEEVAIEVGPAVGTRAECRTFGDQWLKQARTPLLRVPSAIVAESTNLLLNPRHPDAPRASIVASRTFQFDERVFG